MKIALVSSVVPLVNGGARFIVEWLEHHLKEHGHKTERFYLPFVDRPHDLLQQIAAYRMVDLSQSADRIISFRPPAYVLPHPNKILWFIHHIRVFYDLWNSPYRPVPDDPKGRALRQALVNIDNKTLREAKAIYTNSKIVRDRLLKFNRIRSTPLYPPLFQPERFFNAGRGDTIVSVCRLEPHKRQHLMVEAMRHVKSGVRLLILGQSSNPAYTLQMQDTIARFGLETRVAIEDRWISEEEKVTLLSNCLAAAYLPLDEDSYGYPSLEAGHSRKAVVTAFDSGGVLELVQHERNGLIVSPDPKSIAEGFDRLFLEARKTQTMGEENLARIRELNIDWHHVVEAMTA
jgi:glycosyltransferase involved in cell wall biosynthesis